jgi:glycosyltransferase involved in cell wall biosynthesis
LTGDVQPTPLDSAPGHSSLSGVRICLVFENSLKHYSRLLDEIAALREEGASVLWLTSDVGDEGAPPGVGKLVAPLDSSIAGSTARWRPLRVARNLWKEARASVADRLRPGWTARCRVAALHRIAARADVIWVIDFPSLPTAMVAAREAGAKVIYETVDLVPEYRHRGDRYRRMSLEEEGRLIGEVDGFITACDSYADYYVERFGAALGRRPVVRDNMPGHVAPRPKETTRPLQLLFLGALLPDRPVEELIRAIALASLDVTLTFQGRNHLGDAPEALVVELGLQDRVVILDPCPPSAIVETAASYDIGVVALRGENENERRASTSKLFTCMAAGLAVLGSDLPGIARIVRRHENGVLVDGMRPADWAAAIDTLAAMPDAGIDALKRRSLDAAWLYAWEKQRPAFVTEFVRALGRAGGEANHEA